MFNESGTIFRFFYLFFVFFPGENLQNNWIVTYKA